MKKSNRFGFALSVVMLILMLVVGCAVEATDAESATSALAGAPPEVVESFAAHAGGTIDESDLRCQGNDDERLCCEGGGPETYYCCYWQYSTGVWYCY